VVMMPTSVRSSPRRQAITGDSFSYDQANRLTSATVGGTTSQYSYDGDGKRASSTVGATTTRYVYDVNVSLPVLLEDGTRKYVWGLGLAYAVDSGGTVEVYHMDGLGSVRAITNAAGSVVQTYQTDEFGIPTQTQGSSTQRFQYTGEQQDAETGFLYLRARMYDPSIGRFLQRDPLPGVRTAPLSLHRYAYVENDPVNAVDPSGLAPEIMKFSNDCIIQHDGGYLINVVCCTNLQVLMETEHFRVVWIGGMIFVLPSIRLSTADPGGSNNNPGDDAAQGQESELRRFMRSLNRRLFHRFLDSVQSAAAEAGGATRTAAETRESLDEALERNYRLVREDEPQIRQWIGGRHAHLISPDGQIVHFPLPPGFHP
jgi:RHS repeat-associated protein